MYDSLLTRTTFIPDFNFVLFWKKCKSKSRHLKTLSHNNTCVYPRKLRVALVCTKVRWSMASACSSVSLKTMRIWTERPIPEPGTFTVSLPISRQPGSVVYSGNLSFVAKNLKLSSVEDAIPTRLASLHVLCIANVDMDFEPMSTQNLTGFWN